MTALPVSPVEALSIVAKTQFRPFDDSDWSAWAGCESAEPFIGEYEDIVVILDGEAIVFNRYGEDDGEPEWVIFNLSFSGDY